MMVILLLLFLGSIQHSGAKPSDSNINMNNVKIKTKPGSQHASAMTEQDTSGQCKNIGRSGGILTCDGRKFDMSHIPCNSVRTEIDGNTGITTLFCNGRKIDVSQLKEITGNDGTQTSQTVNNAGPTGTGQTNGDGQTCRQVQSHIAVWYRNGVCHRCRGNQHLRNNQVFCDGTEVDQNGRPIDQNQNNPVWTGNDIRGQTFRGQDINQDQTNGFNSNTVRQGDHDHDHDHDLLGPGGKDYDNYDIKDWINWANTIKQLQLFEEKGGKPSAGGEKGGEP